ncbi:recombinase RecT [Terasakiella pusilla]|uniref:recombinase RecT n=1 Tax=Terasakiella pusilla TaxID=64973 RepID=UPI003AA8312F
MSNLPAQQQQQSPVKQVGAVLERMKPQLQMALPKHLTPDRMIRVALAAINKTPKLLECNRDSLYAAIMTSAQLGLEPDGVLGQAYLIPFGKDVQFIPGYKGLIALARNSGDVSSIQAQAVRAGDHFDYGFGLNERLDHVPSDDPDRENKPITHFWAMAKFKDGGHHWDVMTVAQVEAIRDGSQGYKSAKRFAKNGKINSPWVDHFEEMGKKTVIRRIAKYLPMDVQKAAYISDSYDTGKHTTLDMSGELVINDPDVVDGESEEVKKVENKSNQLDDFANTEQAHDDKTIEIADHTGEVTAVADLKAAKARILTFLADAPVEKAKEQIIKNNLDLINQLPKKDADEIAKAATTQEEGQAAQ